MDFFRRFWTSKANIGALPKDQRLMLLEIEDAKRWNAVFDDRSPEFRTFLLERYDWPFEDQHVRTLVRVIRPHLKARFQREAKFMLDRFPTGSDIEIESIEQYTLLYMEPLLETLHEWSDARSGLAEQITPRINTATVMRACYAFREASEDQSKDILALAGAIEDI